MFAVTLTALTIQPDGMKARCSCGVELCFYIGEKEQIVSRQIDRLLDRAVAIDVLFVP